MKVTRQLSLTFTAHAEHPRGVYNQDMKINLTFDDLGKLFGNGTGFEKGGATITIGPRVLWEVTLDHDAQQVKSMTVVFRRDETGG